MLADTSSSLTTLSGKRVLVTGAAGFVGSHLVEELLAANAEVLGVDNFVTGSVAHVDFLKQLPNGAHFTFIQADVNSDPRTYLPTNFSPDVVLHFASPASPPRYQAHPVETYLVNSWGTHLLLTWLHEVNPAAQFVFASTSEVYGDPAVHPQTENYWGNVNPNGVRSCYDEAKRMGESIGGVFQREFKMDVRIVRIFNTYGPRMDLEDGRVIPNFIRALRLGEPLVIYGDGSQTRSYCYVKDLVRGVLAMASGPTTLAGETVNLGNPEEFTIKETVAVFEELAGKELAVTSAPLPGDDPTRRRPDISKAQQLLGWAPKTPFRDGLQQTIASYGL